MPELTEVMRSQRACRRFTDEPVDDATVLELLELACRAPSAENRQPWRFVVVRDADRRAALGEIMRRIWETGGRAHTEGRVSKALFDDVDAGLAGGGLAGAPVMVVVGGDGKVVAPSSMASSVLPAVQNLLLAAASKGLGSCLTTIATVRGDEVRTLVAFPDHIDPIAVVPIGHPARALGPSRREPAASKTFRERYGQSWV